MTAWGIAKEISAETGGDSRSIYATLLAKKDGALARLESCECISKDTVQRAMNRWVDYTSHEINYNDAEMETSEFS